MAGRKRIYEDDALVSKCFRLSIKYEWIYMLIFLKILRKFRKQAVEFIEKYRPKL